MKNKLICEAWLRRVMSWPHDLHPEEREFHLKGEKKELKDVVEKASEGKNATV